MIKLNFLIILLMLNLSLMPNLYAKEAETMQRQQLKEAGKTATVMGRITYVGNKSIENLTVSIWIEDKFDFTDVDGRYRIKDVPSGQHTIKIMREGLILKKTEITVIEVDKPLIMDVDIDIVGSLVTILKDKDSGVQRKAAEALAKIGAPAVEALAKIGEPAVHPLIAAFKEVELDVQEWVAGALAKIGEPAVGPLIAALKDEDWVVRGLAAKALGNIKDPRAVEPLITTLKDKDWGVRDNAAEALAKIGEPAIQPLIAALKNKDWRVPKGAAWALAKIGEPAVQPLIDTLKDKDSGIREGAAEALEKITEQDFRKDQVKWQEWWEENKGKFRMGKGVEVKR